MLFERRFAELIRTGEVTTTFRRWSKPQVVAGRRYRVALIGFIDVIRIAPVDEASVKAPDARRAGFASVPTLFDYLDAKTSKPDATLYRIDLRYCGDATPDPRAQLAQRVYSVELIEELAVQARRRLAQQAYTNIEIRVGNGCAGWPEQAPFDRIIVTAAPDLIPVALDQLAPGGRMVVPAGLPDAQQLLLVEKDSDDTLSTREILPVRFSLLEEVDAG